MVSGLVVLIGALVERVVSSPANVVTAGEGHRSLPKSRLGVGLDISRGRDGPATLRLVSSSYRDGILDDG
jgi:hypothetical protein